MPVETPFSEPGNAGFSNEVAVKPDVTLNRGFNSHRGIALVLAQTCFAVIQASPQAASMAVIYRRDTPYRVSGSSATGVRFVMSQRMFAFCKTLSRRPT